MVRSAASNGKFYWLPPDKENTALIGLFYEAVTWNNNTLLDGKRRTVIRNFKQRDYIIQRANILSFQGLTASFAIQLGVFGTMRPF